MATINLRVGLRPMFLFFWALYELGNEKSTHVFQTEPLPKIPLLYRAKRVQDDKLSHPCFIRFQDAAQSTQVAYRHVPAALDLYRHALLTGDVR